MSGSSRQAILRVHRLLLEQFLPDWQTVARLRYGDVLDGRAYPPERAEEWAAPFHKALKLPADCKITGISYSGDDWLCKDEIVFRIESPDFVETPYPNRLPEVTAVYQRSLVMQIDNPDGCDGSIKPGSAEIIGETGYFLKWTGPAVTTQRTYGPSGEEVSINLSSSCPNAAAIPKSVTVQVDGVAAPFRCWSCKQPTNRLLLGGTAECQECADKPLL